MKSTKELLHEIQSGKDISEYLEENQDEILHLTLPEYLKKWLKEKNTNRAMVVRKSNLSKPYVYQIFQGKKSPSRDKIIAISFGFEMDCDETQTLLKQAGFKELYPRDRRDALILSGIRDKLNIIDMNERLYDHEVEVLD